MSSKRIVLIGDSLAQGLGPPLHAIARGVPCAFDAFGQQSTRVHQWAQRVDLRAVVGSPPADLVLVSLGTNDMRTSDPAAAGAEAGALVDQLASMGASVAWLAPPQMAFDQGTFRPALEAACKARSVPIFDARSLDLERAADGIHLTPRGYGAWAEAIAGWVPFTAYASAAPNVEPPAATTPPAPERDGRPRWLYVDGFGLLALEDYVARVVTAEIGNAREPHALAAQALAARSYVTWMMKHKGYGTQAKPVPNSEKFQVCARAPMSRCVEATNATHFGLVLHRGRVILASYVAGALWRPGAPTGDGGKDPTNTERFVTYNQGRFGEDVTPTRLAGKIEDNRGCFSQNGAMALAQRGLLWPAILRYFYGQDISFTCPEPVLPVQRPRMPEPPREVVPSNDTAPPMVSQKESSGDASMLLAAAIAAYRLLS